ncbi:OPRPN isoform 1 [Pan troglodytes]|uniref:Opiorphin prepropeptide n=2 Tax=Pan troglodytes TaxID=9598 RepID=H2QPL7_PANTR|nr:opiorphin prepropeptide isoform X1 [Pan troglodytes]PNI82666.1 OPRPN isoform 1 [Pan troglodytes]
MKLTFLLGLLALISCFTPSESQRFSRRPYLPGQLPPPPPYRPRWVPPSPPPPYGSRLNSPLSLLFVPGRVPPSSLSRFSQAVILSQLFPLESIRQPRLFPGYPNLHFPLRPYYVGPIRILKPPFPPTPFFLAIYLPISNPEPQINITTADTTITTNPPTTATATTSTSTKPTMTVSSSTVPISSTPEPATSISAATPAASTENTTQILTNPPHTVLLNATVQVTTSNQTILSSPAFKSFWQKLSAIFG